MARKLRAPFFFLLVKVLFEEGACVCAHIFVSLLRACCGPHIPLTATCALHLHLETERSAAMGDLLGDAGR